MKLYTTTHDDLKLRRISDKAFRFYVCALSWCGAQDSDGVYDAVAVPKRIRSELVAKGLWHETEDPDLFYIHGWSERQVTRAELAERSARGKAAVNARWDAARNAGRMQKEILTKGNRTKGKDQTPPASAMQYSAEFEQFWSHYPLKRDKGGAFKEFKKARLVASLEDLIAGADRYASDPSRDPTKTKFAQGWLSGHRWLDEAAPSPEDAVIAYIERTGG